MHTAKSLAHGPKTWNSHGVRLSPRVGIYPYHLECPKISKTRNRNFQRHQWARKKAALGRLGGGEAGAEKGTSKNKPAGAGGHATGERAPKPVSRTTKVEGPLRE